MPVWALVMLNLFFGGMWLHALVTGRIAPSTIARSDQYATRQDTPFFYWAFMLLLTAVFAMPASSLLHRLIPSVPSLFEVLG